MAPNSQPASNFGHSARAKMPREKPSTPEARTPTPEHRSARVSRRESFRLALTSLTQSSRCKFAKPLPSSNLRRCPSPKNLKRLAP